MTFISGASFFNAATKAKELLNEIHTVFCQEVNRQWPMLPSGTTLEDLMLELRKKLFAKKAKELKDAGIDRAETKL